MDVSETIVEIQDGGIGQQAHPATDTTLSSGECGKSETKNENVTKKKRRRGKSKRKKIMKPYVKMSWQERRRNSDKLKRIDNRPRKMISLTKTRAPFNNNQFLMEIHKPEPDKNAEGRTRDSSFSIDSDENYLYSLPEDEEDFLTKEFSSVYEDAQCERLANMSKNEIIQEYLLLETKYENLTKRTRIKDSEPNEDELKRRIREQEEMIKELRLANEKLRQQHQHCSSSADSESDSCTSNSLSSSSSSESQCNSPYEYPAVANGIHSPETFTNGTSPGITMQGSNENSSELNNSGAINMTSTQ